MPLLPETTTCAELADLFARNAQLPAYVIRCGDDGYDLVDRNSFLTRYLYRFNRDIYRRALVTYFRSTRALAVAHDTETERVGLLITAEHPELLSSGVVITRGGEYAGIVLSIDLIRAIALNAQDASQAKNTFVANMNHEIRTPLNAILGNLELLALSELNAEQRELARMARISADALLEVIGDLLDLSKIQANRLELEAVDTGIAELVDQVLTIMNPRARQKGLRLVARIGSGVPDSILTDPVRTRQVLLNFVANSVKFTASGGVFITVTTGAGLSGAPVLRFEVVDTGPGFDPAKAAALFEPFTQEDVSTTRRFGGTGLGLAISKAIITQAGGEIGCDAAPGLGATFWCTLPIRGDRPPGENEPPDLRGCRVAVTGGHRARALIADHLRRHGAELAGHAPAQLRVVAIGAADDFEASQLDRTALRTPNAPIVLAAENPSARLKYRALRAGADHVIHVPGELADLCRLVGLVAGQRDKVVANTKRPKPFVQANGTVLVIDDTLTNRQLASRQLLQLGLASDLAENGQEGLKLATAKTYSAILVDGTMPVMDGAEFIRRWRAFEAEQNAPRTPLIAMTAHTLVGDAEKFISLGADGYLPKPVMLAKLQAALLRCLPGQAAAKPEGTPAAAIDFEKLAEILGNSEPGGLRDLLGVFTGDFPNLMGSLAQSLRDADRQALARSAHAAKSAAGSACAAPLAQLLASIESQAFIADLAQLEWLLGEVQSEFERVETEMAATLR